MKRDLSRPSPVKNLLDQQTIAACATALPSAVALLRLSGPAACAVAGRAGLRLPRPWRMAAQDWPLAGGSCPCRVLFAPAGRSYTGCDLVEITLPGAPGLVSLALEQLWAHGASPAGPGAFTRQALTSGRLDWDGALAVLALSRSSDEAARQAALTRLHGALAQELAPLRERLIEMRALVEAGLDFADEADVHAFDPCRLQGLLADVAATLGRWRQAALDLGTEPAVALAGPANAGKSALYAALSGAPALVSPIAGTTRDWLETSIALGQRTVRLVDTAGWWTSATGLDAAGIEAGRRRLEDAALIVLCSAPDAPAPAILPAGIDPRRVLRLATKADLGTGLDTHAALSVSVQDPASLEALRQNLAQRLGTSPDADPEQQRLLAAAQTEAHSLAMALPADEVLALRLRALADQLAALVGATPSDAVLEAVFARFCIGK